MDVYKMVNEYLDTHFPNLTTEDILVDTTTVEADIHSIRRYLQKTYKIVIAAVPSIDPKYNTRLWYTLSIYEWSRSYEFWMNKSQGLKYYDTEEKALCFGLLQGLEIAKIKRDGTRISK